MLDRWLIRSTTLHLTLVGLLLTGLLVCLSGREIDVDEGWLGQQVLTRAETGEVRTPLFRDVPPLDRQIVLYHSVFIEISAAWTSLVGWGLMQLRLLSFLAGLALLAILWLLSKRGEESGRGLVLLLACSTPALLNGMVIFRPELFGTALGMTGFLLLTNGMESEKGKHWYLLLAGLFAGLATAAHPICSSFPVATLVTCWYGSNKKKRLQTLLLATTGCLIGFSPWGIGFVREPDLFLQQALHNPLFPTGEHVTLWSLLRSPFEDHKRWFRNAEVIGFSVLLLLTMLSLLLRRTGQPIEPDFRRLMIFLIASIAWLAILPVPKLSRYLLPVIPLAILVISHQLRTSSTTAITTHTWLGRIKQAQAVWLLVMIAYACFWTGANGIASNHRQVEANNRLGMQLPDDAAVMAPIDFVFEQAGRLSILSSKGAELRHPKPDRTPAQLEDEALINGCSYMILSDETIRIWHLQPSSANFGFASFQLLDSVPDQHRWMLGRRK